MIRVKATREGLIGEVTATGWVIDEKFPFVALPSVEAKWRWVKLVNPLTGLKCCAQVLDVGPHLTNDDAYVFHGKRPLAERLQNTNGAGIDLGEQVWHLLGMRDNTEVEWEFVDFGDSEKGKTETPS